MKKELRNRILAYNRAAAEHREKATDMDILVAALGKLPSGQLKKVLTEDVIAVLNKHGAGIA